MIYTNIMSFSHVTPSTCVAFVFDLYMNCFKCHRYDFFSREAEVAALDKITLDQVGNE